MLGEFRQPFFPEFLIVLEGIKLKQVFDNESRIEQAADFFPVNRKGWTAHLQLIVLQCDQLYG